MSEPVSQSNVKIFICYRHADSEGYTGRLFDRLASHFGEDRVFIDIEQMRPGTDFVQVIEEAVGSCDILIAVIGRRWLTTIDGNDRSLNNPNDYVRQEIAAALKRNVRIIPVLVERASMPMDSTLPDDISSLSRLHAFELSYQRWNHDVSRLIMILESAAEQRIPPAPTETTPVVIDTQLRSINCPFTGIFRDAASPGAKPFVEVGSLVESDTVVCIIESMGADYEINAGTSGRVEVVYAANYQLVEDGEPMFGITGDDDDILEAALKTASGATPPQPSGKRHIIMSPIVGTFYRSGSPTADPYVQIGSHVEPNTVVCIIEAMKLMNEIYAEVTGTVESVYVEHGVAVGYDQPLFQIKQVEEKPIPKPAPKPPPEEPSDELHVIKSPIVGFFYRAPTPVADSFVRIGSHVDPSTVVCIIEAMKLMNEIQAEVTGTVEKIYVENGQAVEYGQPLFGVRK